MKCPHCKSTNVTVIDSRPTDQGIKRRRLCIECQARFTTYERLELPNLEVIKRDGSKEPFDRNKIYRSFMMALSKNPHTKGTLNISNASREIEDALVMKGSSTVTSAAIGEMVMQKLVDIDKVAYLRFALVYKKYENLEQVVQEINNLISG